MDDSDDQRKHGLSRRGLLKRAGLGAAAATLLDRIGMLQQTFADELRADTRQAGSPIDDSPLDGAPFSGLHLAYSLDPSVTYLNHASIGTIPRAIQRSHARYLELCEQNPWLYMWGGAWEGPRESIRAKAAHFLGCTAEDVTFSHNTTETFNLLAQGLPLGPGDEVLVPNLNHSGASVCFELQAERRGYTVRRFDLGWDDATDVNRTLERYAEAVGARTRLLVLPHVDNTVGLRHPVAAVAQEARRRGVEFIAIDAAQTVGMIPIDVSALGVDAYATSPHKWLQAPKGLGLSYLGSALREALQPMWMTWGQQRWQGSARRFEDYGTRNLAAVLALGDALDFHGRLDPAARVAHHRRLHAHAYARTQEIPRLAWRSPADFDQGGALYAIDVDGQPARSLAQALFTEHGIVTRGFEHPGWHAIRLSPNLANTTADLDRFFDAVRGSGEPS